MKILSLNVRGFGVKDKFGWVKGLCSSEKPDIAAFQETKCKTLEDRWVRSLWGNENFRYIQKEDLGNSGGMLLVWDTSRFSVNKAVGNKYFTAIRGNWVGSGGESIIVNIYGPHNDIGKKEMWGFLDGLMMGVDSAWVLCGDFNEVRCQSERLNCVFSQSRASRFNDFIDRNSLIEIPINGKRFTRVSGDGIKISKLDHFLVNDNFIKLWDDLSVIALDRMESDHCPLILRSKVIDFGQKPFKVFDEWLNREGVDRVILDGWNSVVRSSKKDCVFRDKLKNVKTILRSWSKSEFGGIDDELSKLKSEVSKWESLAEQGGLSDTDRERWLDTRRKWIDKEKSKTNMLRQKTRIWWLIEGDENTKFFHSSIKRKYNKSNI
ncbi:uncharacterized protein [Rutidosis leptorrhynchoides]|uniref:uncharacterized protein n=1 Tax=Rutidosis leptorrhynchoides TaxID=125765 RepID=UPI003A994F3E